MQNVVSNRPGLCVKSFITIDRETTDPSGIENLITTRRTTKRTTFVALGDPFRV